MRRFMLTNEPGLYFAPKEPAGGDPTPEPEPIPDPPKVLTEKDIQEAVAKAKLEAETQIKKIKEEAEKKQAEADKKFADFQAELDKKLNPPPDPDDLKGRLNILEKERAKDKEAWEVKERTYKEQLEKETRLRDQLEITTELSAALDAAGCVDIELGKRAFFQDIFRDEDTDTLKLKLPGGGTAPLKEGIISNLPALLKKPDFKAGGSGTRNTPAAQKRKAELEAARAEEKELQKAAQASNSTAAIHKWQKQKLRIKELEKEAASH